MGVGQYVNIYHLKKGSTWCARKNYDSVGERIYAKGKVGLLMGERAFKQK